MYSGSWSQVGKKMDLKQLQYFVVSVDSGSLKKAAEILYTSQPHISKTIKSLEAELQTVLLTRKARGVEATETGKKVYEHACRILMETGKIQNVRGNRTSCTLSVTSVLNNHLADLFRRFYTEELKCRIPGQYMECSMKEIFQRIHRHTAELGFVHVDMRQMTAFLQTLEYRYLEFAEIHKETPLLFVGPKNPLYMETMVTNKELRNLQYVQMKEEQEALNIHLVQGTDDYRYYRSHGQIMLTNSREMVLKLVQATSLGSISCGLSVEEGEREGLRGIPIRGTKNSIVFGYIRRKRDGMSLAAAQFADYVKKNWNM